MEKKKAKKDNLKEVLPSWNLNVAFYSSLDDPQIDVDIESVKRACKNIARFEGRLETLEPYEFEMFVTLYEGVVTLVNKLYRYAHLYSDVEKTNEKATSFAGSLDAELEEELDKLHFIFYELAQFSWDKRVELMNSPRLRNYVPWLKRVFASYLPTDIAYIYDALDFIQNKKSATDNDWSELYNKICSSMVFEFNGKTYNIEEIRSIRFNTHDPKVEKAAACEMRRVYKMHAPYITSIFNSILKNEDVDAKLNGYYNAEQASSTGNVVPREHLLELVSAVCDSFYPVSRKFYALKAKLNASAKCWPVNSPIKVADKKYTWKECKKIVLDAYEAFSPTYAESAKSIIDANIIDVAPKPGKKNGAYCMSGSVPYIFLNFTGSDDDLNTFAHELGHGVNHLYAAKQGILNDRTPISLAEVASEFAEFILYNKRFIDALGKNDEKQMLYLAYKRLENMVATVQRQIAIYNFEKRAHSERQDGDLTTERLNEIWAEEYERYTGLKLEGDARYEWMFIPHLFNSPFYVYCYAFAGFIVNNLIKVYSEDNLEHKEIFDFQHRFLQFLTNTGVEFYPDLLETFEIDVNDPDFWKEGTKVMKDMLEYIEEESKRLGLI